MHWSIHAVFDLNLGDWLQSWDHQQCSTHIVHCFLRDIGKDDNVSNTSARFLENWRRKNMLAVYSRTSSCSVGLINVDCGQAFSFDMRPVLFVETRMQILDRSARLNWKSFNLQVVIIHGHCMWSSNFVTECGHSECNIWYSWTHCFSKMLSFSLSLSLSLSLQFFVADRIVEHWPTYDLTSMDTYPS